ncbi:MAG: sigma-70 family RNA polymerase sigma factor [Lachnospiraceae bacterium]|nr:sigma-70 family RNA polymerase sigma factor [Lachnospiraceae bacterium]
MRSKTLSLQDREIIDLYWDRDQTAIQHTDEKYGKYCHTVAWNILRQNEDCEECVNDTYLKAWNAMPPERPAVLKFFLTAIVRNLSLDLYRKNHREKRGAGEIALALDELAECIPSDANPEEEAIGSELGKLINIFLGSISERDRNVFVRRYYFLETASEIGEKYMLKEANVLMILSRTRKKLAEFLGREGYMI